MSILHMYLLLWNLMSILLPSENICIVYYNVLKSVPEICSLGAKNSLNMFKKEFLIYTK